MEFEERDEERLDFMLWVLFISTFVAIVLNILRNVQALKFMKAKLLIDENETFYESGLVKWCAMEVFILLLQPYPFLQGIKIYLHNRYYDVEIFYFLNDFLSLTMIFRLYVILRFILNTTIYRSPRAQRLANMYGAENNYLYAVKCLMNQNPGSTSMILLCSSIFVFAYAIRISERPLNRYSFVAVDLSTYGNCMWLTMITMVTVGYGDFFPRTDLGRVIVFVNCIWGVVVVSLMCVTLNNLLSMSGPEDRSLIVLERLELRKTVKDCASNVLTNMALYGITNRRQKQNSTSEKEYENLKTTYASNIKSNLESFKRANRDIRNLADTTNLSEEMTRQFEFVRDEMKNMFEQQHVLENKVKNLTEQLGIVPRFSNSKKL